jgi:hypothetical protein
MSRNGVTDDHWWDRVEDLFPTQPAGRPRHSDRTVLNEILYSRAAQRDRLHAKTA